jgi:uncharacterized protein YdhG (YjbR/CyaY superfamily)
MGELSDYLGGLDEPVRSVLTHVRDVATGLVPGVEEGRSYGIRALIHRGKPLLGLQVTARHLSLFPFSSTVVEAVTADLDGFSLSKGTIRFTAERPVPDAVLTRIIELRRDEIEARSGR